MRQGDVSRRALLGGVASLGSAVCLPGCADVDLETNYERSVEQSHGVAMNSLAVEMPRGEVSVRGTDGHEVTLSGSIVGERQDVVEATEIVGDLSEGHLTLTARRDGQAVEDVRVSLTVHTPRDTRVTAVTVDGGTVSMGDVRGPSRAVTGSGTVSVEGVTGRLAAVARRGDVSVAEVDGSVSVSLSEGEVSVADVDGDVSVREVEGDVSVTGVEGDVRAEASVGFISVSDVTGDVTATVETGDTDVVDVDGRVRTSRGGT